MIQTFNTLENGKKIYFASDFHLGVPTYEKSLEREKKIIRWLDAIKHNAEAIFLVGDIFDFWFEYAHAIPKGFIRFQGKIAELTDAGIKVYFFTGNHDMWMFDYFEKELNVPIIRKPISISVGNKKLYIGHGDGLGPKDYVYKLLKLFFSSKACQWMFARLHPNLGIGIANAWSRKSRISSSVKEDIYLGENEWLLIYAKEMQVQQHHDYYIFGHRHLPLNVEVDKNSRYINLGEWVHHFTYAEFDGNELTLLKFED